MDNYSLAVGVIVIKDEKVLLVKHNYGSANGKYLNPGGYLQGGELPEDAAVREVFEETNIHVDNLAMIAVRCQTDSWYMVFKGEYAGGEPRSDGRENDDAVFMDINEALSDPLVTDTAKLLIRIAMSGKAIISEDRPKNRVIYSVDKI